MKSRAAGFFRRPIESYSKLALGVTALAVIVVVIAATLIVSSLDLGKDEYKAEFLQVAQLSPGDVVSVAGVPVGEVTGTELAGDHVVVKMMIDSDIPMGTDTRAEIKLTTLLGSRYLELLPAGTGEIPDRTIPLSQTSVPYDLQKTLTNATTTFENVDAARIGESLTTLAGQLQGAPEVIPQALDNIKALSDIIADRRADLGSLLSSTSEITTVLSEQKSSLGVMFDQGNDLLRDLAARRETLHSLLNATTTLVTQLRDVVVEDQPAIDELLGNLETMTNMLASHDDLFRNILQILPVTLRNATNATGTSDGVDAGVPGGPFINSWMCALSGRAQQVNLPEYFRDCQ